MIVKFAALVRIRASGRAGAVPCPAPCLKSVRARIPLMRSPRWSIRLASPPRDGARNAVGRCRSSQWYLPVRNASSGCRVDGAGRRNLISAQVGAAGEDAALLYDVVATAELDAARNAEECDDDAALLMALSRS